MAGAVRGIRQSAVGVRIEIGGTTYAASYLAAADGLHSPIRQELGLDRPKRRHRRYGLRRHFQVAPWSDQVEVHWSRHAELYVTPVLWPDFTRQDFFEAVAEYQGRERRFGRVSV